jgi:vancomycin resistance protein YoaR
VPRLPRFPGGRRARLAGAVVGGLVAVWSLLAIAAVLDGALADDVGRGVSVGGVDVGGASPDELRATVAELAAAYGDTPVEIDAGAGPATTDAATLGLSIDEAATVAEVLDESDPPLPLLPIAWIGSFLGSREVTPTFTVDEAVLSTAVTEIELPGITAPTEPGLEADERGVRLVPGTVGSGIRAETLGARLVRAAADGDVPVRVEPELVDVAPSVPDDVVAAVAADAEAATAAPLPVVVGEDTGELEVAALRSWLRLELADGDADWTLDAEAVRAGIEARFAEAGADSTPVRFTVEDGRPVVLPGTDGTVCCEDDSAERVESALRSGERPVELALTRLENEEGLEWADSLGIVEEVASFTSEHRCCENRVINIHRIADDVRGVVIEPGETFSLNGHVGRRTAEKGYVAAGGITNGVLVPQLGGGISQFTTALFNAAFFAGLDFGEYQSHSIYFSRYPYGREATLSFPAPDLEIVNTTPYGVLVWPTYTDTAITVTLYSTRHVVGEQTGQRTQPQGACTRVITERTRTWTDGRVEVDSVQALYRPGEGLNCAGEPTVPPTTEAPPPPPTTEAPPPTTAPPASSTTTAPPTSTTTTAPPPTSTSAPPTTAPPTEAEPTEAPPPADDP